MIIYLGNSNAIEIPELVDPSNNAAVTDATVQAWIKDLAGVEVTGQTWPLTLTHLGSGRYFGTVAETLAVELGKSYRWEVRATSGGLVGFWEGTATPTKRGATDSGAAA